MVAKCDICGAPFRMESYFHLKCDRCLIVTRKDAKGERYIVSVWHGEGGSIAEVRDTLNPDECLAIYSTNGKAGAEFKALADEYAAALNGGQRTLGEWRARKVAERGGK